MAEVAKERAGEAILEVDAALDAVAEASLARARRRGMAMLGRCVVECLQGLQSEALRLKVARR